MTALTLVVRPDGRAVLACRDRLSTRAQAELMDAVRGWEAGQYPVLIIPDCDVVQVAELELDLEPKAAG